MNFRWPLICLALVFPLSCNAEIFAESSGLEHNNYLGINVSSMRFDPDGSADTRHSGLSFRYGHEFNNYFALEGHAAFGLEDDTVAGVLDVSIDYLLGFYARGNIFLWSPRARLYGLIGLTHGKLSADISGNSDDQTNTELGYGAGIELFGNGSNGITLEFMRYMDGEDNNVDFNIDSVSIGYTHRF